MSTNAYSPLKVYWHGDRLAAIRAGQTPPPSQIQLIISDLCNQDCSFCAYRMSGYSSNELFKVVRDDGTVNNNPNRMIPFEKICEILDDAKAMGTRAIQLTGGGEPTVHPQFSQVVQRCIDLSLEFALVSNGVRLTPAIIDQLMSATWVRISIDAAQESSYQSIRRVPSGHFAKAWGSIHALVARKRETQSAVTLGVGFVVTKDNWREVYDFTLLARDAGVDNVRISAIFQPEDEAYFKDFISDASVLCRQAASLSTDIFHVINMFGDRVEDLTLHYPDYDHCGYQKFNTYIGADLNVYRCCVLAYNTQGIIGSLRTQRFRDLWAVDAPKAFNGFCAGSCPRCQFNNKNREINKALAEPVSPEGPPPPHVNFV